MEDRIKKAKRVARAAEVIIRKALVAQYRLPKTESVFFMAADTMDEYQKRCYPMGLADERIADFLLYQIYRMRDNILSSQKAFHIEWVFSTNGVEKYKAQFLTKDGKSGMRYYIDEWMSECGLTMQMVLNVIAEPSRSPLASMIFLPSEEPVKRRWYGTEMGYMLCAKDTTGWSPMSASCKECVFKEKCERTTTEKYPELVRLRKEQ